MVLGVNSNNNCESLVPEDYICLVFFKPILNNTEFYITDNRFTGSNFTTTEGTLLVKRTGGTLAAGTVVKIGVLSNGTGTSSGWSITKAPSGANFNLNTNGDQFLIWQGTWNGANGNYTGNFLLGFNTKRIWNGGLTPASENGNLPSVLTCHHQSFNLNENRRYRFYDGPTNSISHGEWLVRILNNDRWKNDIPNDVNGCNLFNSSFILTNIPIQTSIPQQEICEGELLTDLEVVDETNVVQYQWFSNNTASNSGGTLIPGAMSHTYTPSNTTVGVTYYYCEMRINLPLNGTSNTTDCTFTSNVFEVTVHPNPITSPVTPL